MSFTEISIKERFDPISVAMKYAIRNLGINVRPSKWEFNREEDKYIIHLDAIIPNEISPLKKSKKSINITLKKNVKQKKRFLYLTNKSIKD